MVYYFSVITNQIYFYMVEIGHKTINEIIENNTDVSNDYLHYIISIAYFHE